MARWFQQGAGDLEGAVMTAVVNKRAGGMGLISGYKTFQRPMKVGFTAVVARFSARMHQDGAKLNMSFPCRLGNFLLA